MTRNVTLALAIAVFAIAGCKSLDRDRADTALTESAIDLRATGNTKAADVIDSINLDDAIDPDRPGYVDAGKVKDMIAAEIAKLPAADQNAVADAIQDELHGELEELGLTPFQIAMIIGLPVTPLILRKVLPIIVATATGTPVGAFVGPIVNSLFFSKSTYEKAVAKKNGA